MNNATAVERNESSKMVNELKWALCEGCLFFQIFLVYFHFARFFVFF